MEYSLLTLSSSSQSKKKREIHACIENCITILKKVDTAETIYTYPYSSGDTKCEEKGSNKKDVARILIVAIKYKKLFFNNDDDDLLIPYTSLLKASIKEPSVLFIT